MQTYCFSARKDGQESVLCVCGTISAESMDDAFSQLLKRYPVKVKPSGRLVQTDGKRDFTIRILKPLEDTPEGKAALKAHYEERERQRKQAIADEIEAMEGQIEKLRGMDGDFSLAIEALEESIHNLRFPSYD